jgi:hypothetical protein
MSSMPRSRPKSSGVIAEGKDVAVCGLGFVKPRDSSRFLSSLSVSFLVLKHLNMFESLSIVVLLSLVTHSLAEEVRAKSSCHARL